MWCGWFVLWVVMSTMVRDGAADWNMATPPSPQGGPSDLRYFGDNWGKIWEDLLKSGLRAPLALSALSVTPPLLHLQFRFAYGNTQLDPLSCSLPSTCPVRVGPFLGIQ